MPLAVIPKRKDTLPRCQWNSVTDSPGAPNGPLGIPYTVLKQQPRGWTPMACSASHPHLSNGWATDLTKTAGPAQTLPLGLEEG